MRRDTRRQPAQEHADGGDHADLEPLGVEHAAHDAHVVLTRAVEVGAHLCELLRDPGRGVVLRRCFDELVEPHREDDEPLLEAPVQPLGDRPADLDLLLLECAQGELALQVLVGAPTLLESEPVLRDHVAQPEQGGRREEGDPGDELGYVQLPAVLVDDARRDERPVAREGGDRGRSQHPACGAPRRSKPDDAAEPQQEAEEQRDDEVGERSHARSHERPRV